MRKYADVRMIDVRICRCGNVQMSINLKTNILFFLLINGDRGAGNLKK